MPVKQHQDRLYPKELDFETIAQRASDFAEHIEERRQRIIDTLLLYETYEVATDEIARSTDLLTNLRENQEFFQREIGPVASFLPSNQPLYATSCFTVVPSLMASQSHVKAPEGMGSMYPKLIEELEMKKHFPNVHVHQGRREEFVNKRAAHRRNPHTGALETATDAVIFTGTPEKAFAMRKEFHRQVLFIVNGAGHNPIVVSNDADVDKAVASAMRVQLYNQGQDCAAPNAILVHEDVYDDFMLKLSAAVRKVHVGPYENRQNTVGPLSRPGDLPRIQQILAENSRLISEHTEGIVRARLGIVEPTIIERPLDQGGNFTEQFAPIFFVQRYEQDDDLARYFGDAHYKSHAMYITLYGKSPYVENLVGDPLHDKHVHHDHSTIIRNTDLHAPGVERGVKPYGGYGKGASHISIDGNLVAKPTLPQRDIYEHLVKPSLEEPAQKKAAQPKQIEKKRVAPDKKKEYWGEKVASTILDKFPDRDHYTIAAGASPYSHIHFGSLRDVMTSLAVVRELQGRGKDASLFFSWDDFEPLKAVPEGMNPSLEKYVGMPLSSIPDPYGKNSSHACHFETEFEQAITALGISMDFSSQTERYQSGAYDQWIFDALRQREAYAEMMLRHMSSKAMTRKMIEPDEYRATYYPIIVYSRFTGKSNTTVLDHDGKNSIIYKCHETGNTETVDLTRDRIAKLRWKAEWPIRWKEHGIVFEPGGVSQSVRGGSHDVAVAISQGILGNDTPIYQRYGNVSLREASGTLGPKETGGASIMRLLEVHEPQLLQWIYLHKRPEQDFSIGFGTDVLRQYDEFDVARNKIAQDASHPYAKVFSWVGMRHSQDEEKQPIPFKQAVALGQIVGWNESKLLQLLKKMGKAYEETSISSRLKRARIWMEKHNPNETISLLENQNATHIESMDELSRQNVRMLLSGLQQGVYELEELETLTRLERDPELSGNANRARQRAFCKDVYQLLIGKDSGPRLATLLWALDREKILSLLDV